MTIFKKHSPQQTDTASIVELVPTQEMSNLVKELQTLVKKSKTSKLKGSSMRKSGEERMQISSPLTTDVEASEDT